MSIKIAIATSDGLNVDLHFGKASSLDIYEFSKGKFVKTENRALPQDDENAPQKSEDCSGNGGGCSCGGALSSKASAVLDCKAVVAAKIGPQIVRQLENKTVSAFHVECTVEEALQKLTIYYSKAGVAGGV